ncbi:MAG: hydrogenase formation protein HypD, partial [Candidatus Limnocylindrales bacterium]
LMEVCGGQTHTLVKQGIDESLPDGVRLIHGPGCPVCVTPLEQVDKALAIAARPGVIFASYGDMLRVPGSSTDLLALKARGADVRIIYSPLDAVRLAAADPERQVVFFAIGFETTAPANAMAVWQARRMRLTNFSVLVSHVLVPPAMTAILDSPANQVQAFLAAGHVCAVMGWTEYEPIAARYHVPIVVTGFEPLDLLEGILMAIRQLEEGRAEVENQYVRAVRREGNLAAQETIFRVFEIGDRTWRGIGPIASSGYKLKPEFAACDAEARFEVGEIHVNEHPACIAGEILQGTKTPLECTAYGTLCSPQRPLGAPMVSSEGTCAAFHAAGRGLASAASPLVQVAPLPARAPLPVAAPLRVAAPLAASAPSPGEAR